MALSKLAQLVFAPKEVFQLIWKLLRLNLFKTKVMIIIKLQQVVRLGEIFKVQR
jgi:hypothetical protein